MNPQQFKIWEEQKWREYEADLEKLQVELAAQGLASSGKRNKAEKNLKLKYESEIQIARLGLQDGKEADLYAEILSWTNKKTTFSLEELYTRFPDLSGRLKEWFVSTFRGASDNNDCLIGVGWNDDREHYYYLTSRGRSAYSSLQGTETINIGTIQTTYGDNIRGNKVQQDGNKNKVSIKEGQAKGSWESFFWNVLVALSVGLAIIYIAHLLGWN